MRLLLSGGGTGGHVYPALAVVQELAPGPDELGTLSCRYPIPPGRGSSGVGTPSRSSGAGGQLEALLYVGTIGGMEGDIVRQAGIDFQAVSAAGLRGMSPRRMMANAVALLRGCAQAWMIVRGFRPDVVLATGGYACAPVVFVAWLLRKPVLIYLPDVEPGLAVRLLSRLARRVAVSFEESARWFASGKAVVTGYPVRHGLYQGNAKESRTRLGLEENLRTILVMGGSRGSHSINLAISQVLEEILKDAQVVHIAGEADMVWLRERRDQLAADLHGRYRLFAYLHEEMVDALVAADLAVARSGAATMGEFAAVGLPSILVPYPYAGQHQEANADFLVQHGAALKISDAQLTQGALGPMIKDLLAIGTPSRSSGDGHSLPAMAACAGRLAKPDAAGAIARELALLAGG